MGSAFSEGSVLGPWIQAENPLVDADGGHGMVFKAFDGRLFLTYHSPNDTPNERFRYFEVAERGRELEAVGIPGSAEGPDLAAGLVP
ncbi:MAG: hypothetical protein NT061_00275 [Spirochaetes bacterium]|nr:hypothetical protein [Spirochaetota bacterium]